MKVEGITDAQAVRFGWLSPQPPWMNRPAGMCLKHPTRKAMTRGLCRSCYSQLHRKIQNGYMTERAAVKKGLMLEKSVGKTWGIKSFPQIR